MTSDGNQTDMLVRKETTNQRRKRWQATQVPRVQVNRPDPGSKDR
jgi:hypothetical protein